MQRIRVYCTCKITYYLFKYRQKSFFSIFWSMHLNLNENDHCTDYQLCNLLHICINRHNTCTQEFSAVLRNSTVTREWWRCLRQASRHGDRTETRRRIWENSDALIKDGVFIAAPSARFSPDLIQTVPFNLNRPHGMLEHVTFDVWRWARHAVLSARTLSKCESLQFRFPLKDLAAL